MSPLGGASVTVTAPLVGLPPMFDASRSYEPLPACVNEPLCVLLSTRSGPGGGVANDALTFRAWLIVTWQVGVEPAQSPDQPVNCCPLRPVAVKVTTVPDP